LTLPNLKMPENIRDIAVADIEPDPDNLRKTFDQADIEALAENILEIGQTDPIQLFVRSEREGRTTYDLFDGERRWRAAKSKGLKVLKAIIIPRPTQEELLVRKISRMMQTRDYSFQEQVTALETGLRALNAWDQPEKWASVAAKLGVKPEQLRERMRVVRLSPTRTRSAARIAVTNVKALENHAYSMPHELRGEPRRAGLLLLCRGAALLRPLVLAKKTWYDNRTKTFHILIESEEENGLADGATTDRVLDRVKKEVSIADFETLSEQEIPEYLKEAYVHVEVISGEIGDMLVPLTEARNSSNPVKAFSIENLGGGFDWIKEVIEKSEFRGRIKYKENDPEPVDIRTVLGLLTLFHPKWNDLGREPVIAYTSKGLILDNYRTDDWKFGYKLLAPVVVDILRLYEYIHVNFNEQYKEYNSRQGSGSKLGNRKEVRFSKEKPFTLPLTGWETHHLIADGWLYPLLAAFRMLLVFPTNGRGQVKWLTPPHDFFNTHGHEFVGDVVEQSETLGRNPNATGKSRPLWNNLRKAMELHRMKLEVSNRE
jgi:ParB/RepB/Spo0J family partition protein